MYKRLFVGSEGKLAGIVAFLLSQMSLKIQSLFSSVGRILTPELLRGGVELLNCYVEETIATINIRQTSLNLDWGVWSLSCAQWGCFRNSNRSSLSSQPEWLVNIISPKLKSAQVSPAQLANHCCYWDLNINSCYILYLCIWFVLDGK